MFHTYILAASGTSVDFDRASFLMDRDLLQASIDAMRDEQQNRPRHDACYGAQWVWDYYCERHVEKYGECFVPDVKPGWDSPPKPKREPLRGPYKRNDTLRGPYRRNDIKFLTPKRLEMGLARMRSRRRPRRAKKR